MMDERMDGWIVWLEGREGKRREEKKEAALGLRI